MNVELLTQKDISLYINFIFDVFGYNSQQKFIEEMLKKQKILIIKQNDKIVASAALEERHEYIKEQKYYFISYFGVLKEYRRRGRATAIFNKIESMSLENKINYLEITSGNQRRAAYYFYKNNDFKIKDTTVFVKLYER